MARWHVSVYFDGHLVPHTELAHEEDGHEDSEEGAEEGGHCVCQLDQLARHQLGPERLVISSHHSQCYQPPQQEQRSALQCHIQHDSPLLLLPANQQLGAFKPLILFLIVVVVGLAKFACDLGLILI